MNADQEARREELWSLLGDLPPRDYPVRAEKYAEEDRGRFVLEKLMLDCNGLEIVPAYFLRPAGAEGEPRPTILYNHYHGGRYDLGKTELVDDSALPNGSFSRELIDAGYNVLCIDTWCFGERSGRKESETFWDMLLHGRVMWGMMVYDNIRALDYLATRSDVDMDRLGTMGASMGSTMAWWTAALDTRIKVTVDFCCLTDLEALRDLRGLEWHGHYYFVPWLLKHFTTGDINALIAPRPHLGTAGIYDGLTPVDGLDRIEETVSAAYEAAGAPEAWKLLRYGCGHRVTEHMRVEAMNWFARWL